MTAGTLLVRGGTVVTMGPLGTVRADVMVDQGRITAIDTGGDTGAASSGEGVPTIDATGMLVLPGFVQAHIHLCQTLFRGLADDMEVVTWLRRRIWPLECAHDAASVRASAELGLAELLTSGTTAMLGIETVLHTETSFAAAAEMGMRVVMGPALMNQREPGTEMKGEPADVALARLGELIDTFHGREDGRLQVSVSPRGTRTVTQDLWEACVDLAHRHDLRMHTHAAENHRQAELLALEPGGRDIKYLSSLGALTPRMCMAHCVWLDDEERELLRASGAHVCHCPGSNMKLASGFAPVPSYLAEGVNVALGADGAPCSNTLDMFTQMRLAAIIHKPRYGPEALPAEDILDMATMGGARALGLEHEIGSIEIGKRGDLVLLDQRRSASLVLDGQSPASAVVYGMSAADVDTVIVDGQVVVSGGHLVSADEARIMRVAAEQRRLLLGRCELD